MASQFKRLWAVGLCCLTLSAYAEQYPMTQGFDARVQVFDYNPTDVYLIHTKVGYSTLVQLEDEEMIDDDGGLGMGDAKSWSLAVKGNNVFFKPVAELPDTNMLLVTNKRTYAFELTTKTDATPTYIARFNYPPPPKTAETDVMPKRLQVVGTTAKGQDVYINADINTNYVYRGEPSLKPTNAWDNGRFTYLKFAHASDLPAVYRVLPDNSEVLVNSHIEDDTTVLQETGHIYRLRLGKTVGDVGNQLNRLPAFNTTGTSDSAYIRIDK